MTHPIAQQLQALRAELNAAFHERADTIEAMLLAVLAKEHIYILGPPGTGKSMLVRRFIEAISGARYFECAMSKTRSTEAVLGPLDILEFRQNGHMWRKSKGFITDVEFAFIDEIGKMSPILGHDMLALLNERIVHEVNGGLSSRRAPLYTAFTASNELLTDDSDDAAALWDRLLFRTTVDYIKSGRAFASLLDGPMPPINTKIDFAELADAIDTVVPTITMHKDAMKAILQLRKTLAGKGIHPSDRRWRASMAALRASAFLAGRTEVYEDDLAALRFTLWETIPQIEEIDQLTRSMANPFVEKVVEAIRQLQEVSRGFDERKDKSFSEKGDYARDANPKLAEIRNNLDALLDSANGREIPDFKKAADLHAAVLTRLYVECFGLPEDDARTTIQSKLGKGDGTQPAAAPASA